MTAAEIKISDEILNRVILLNALMEREISSLKKTFNNPSVNHIVSRASDNYKRFVYEMQYLLKSNDEADVAEKMRTILSHSSIDDLSLAFAYLVELSDTKKELATTILKELRDDNLTFVPE